MSNVHDDVLIIKTSLLKPMVGEVVMDFEQW